MRYDRSVQRESPLLPMCEKAKLSKNEYGPQDKRIFCYGFIDGMTDELLEECSNCKAHCLNATPPKKD